MKLKGQNLKLLVLCFIFILIVFPSAVYAATYDAYINALPTPVPITSENQPVVDKLVSEINKMLIDQNNDGVYEHLAPALYLNGTNAGRYGLLYWNTPAELISTLSSAYPYLPASLQTKVKSYLDSEIAAYPPLTTGYFPPNSGRIGQQTGIRREFFPVDPSHNLNFWPGIPVSIEIAYPLWQYTHYTSDRRFVDNTANWNALVNLYNNFKASGQVSYYTQVAGLTGFARLAKLKGDTTLANDATNLAVNALTTTNFSAFEASSNSKLRIYRQTFPVFLFGSTSDCCTHLTAGLFAKEIGQYLKDNELAAVQAYSQRIELRDPLWYLTLPGWGIGWNFRPPIGPDAVGAGESLYAPPEFGWTNFMIHAYILGDNMQTLKNYLDFPSRLGDLFYIQQLVATIEAPGGQFASASPSSQATISPSASPAKPGDIDGDEDVDIFDYNQLLTDFGKTGTGLVSDIEQFGTSANKVDIFDYNLLLTNFGR